MAEEHINNEELGIDDHHPDVAELDAKIAAAAKEDMSDSEKEALEALVAQRNETYKATLPTA